MKIQRLPVVRLLTISIFAISFSCIAAGGAGLTDLRNELEQMRAADQQSRSILQEQISLQGTKASEVEALRQQQHEIDQANLKRLDEIVRANGWPKISELGWKAENAAFLIVQHADLATQLRFLPLLRDAVAQNEAPAANLALLEDRILIGQGKEQMYGSQLRNNGIGGWEFYPIKDEANVDLRRQQIGLELIADYARKFGIEYEKPETGDMKEILQ